MKQSFCCWCDAPIKVHDTYDDLECVAVCSDGCRDAETLFRIFYSDEEQHRRAHYIYLTMGDDDEQDSDEQMY